MFCFWQLKFQHFTQRKYLKHSDFNIKYWFSVFSFYFLYSEYSIWFSIFSSVFRCGFIFICNISLTYVKSNKSLNKTFFWMKSQYVNFRKREHNISMSVHFVLRQLLLWKQAKWAPSFSKLLGGFILSVLCVWFVCLFLFNFYRNTISDGISVAYLIASSIFTRIRRWNYIGYSVPYTYLISHVQKKGETTGNVFLWIEFSSRSSRKPSWDPGVLWTFFFFSQMKKKKKKR